MEKKLLIEKIETKIEEFRESGELYDALVIEGLNIALEIVKE